MYVNSFPELLKRMSETEQAPGLSVHQHGIQVSQSFVRLREELEEGRGNPVLQKVWDLVGDRILPDEITLKYQEFHDCGKPFCKDGPHFPDHQVHSCRQWVRMRPGEPVEALLMKMDMEFHLANSERAKELWEHPLAPTLYFTAWAEILANCKMFGGEDSVSFKMKKKRLERNGRALFS